MSTFIQSYDAPQIRLTTRRVLKHAVLSAVQPYTPTLVYIPTTAVHKSACCGHSGTMDCDDSVPVVKGVWAVGAG